VPVYKKLNDAALYRMTKNIFAKLKYAYACSLPYKHTAIQRACMYRTRKNYKAIPVIGL
jgi:hypothetical protein